MGNKKPRPTVQVTVKLSPQAAEKLYKVINEEFEGNISEALRAAIKLLIKIKSEEPLEVLQLEFVDEKVEKVPAYDADHVGTELIVRLEEEKSLLKRR